MARFAVKELVTLIVVTYVDADTPAQAEELVETMDIFDYDHLIDSDTNVLAVWNEETGEPA